GAAGRPVSEDHSLGEAVYLLVTEALKAAGVARFIAKAATVGKHSGAATQIAWHYSADGDDEKDDDRGKLFADYEFHRTLAATAAVRDVMSTEITNTGNILLDYMNIFVDGVWTVPWTMYQPEEQRPIANPDVLRDARKRLLRDPKLREGLKDTFKSQVLLLEMWLTAVNTIDLVKDFLALEFKN